MDESTERRRVTLVAGGSGAIGRVICQTLAKEGHDIALTYRSKAERGDAAAEDVRKAGGAALALRVELEDSDGVGRFVDSALAQFARIDSVVYASGPHLDFSYVSQITPARWKQVMDADINGCFNFLAAALPHLRKSGSGSIVAVTTAATERVPIQDLLSAAPKVAVEMLVKGIAKEEGRYGIRANCVGPGFTTDGIGGQILEKDPNFAEMLRKQLPMKRFGSAQDIANAVAFFLSDKSSYISGQSLAVDGGFQL